MLARNEDALLAALRGHRDVKRLVRTVDTLPRMVGEKLLRQYVADAPALYLVPGRFTVRDGVMTLRYEVAAVVRNVAGHAAARKGDAKDIGCDQLMVLAVRALHEQRLGDATWLVTEGEMQDEEVFDVAGLTVLSMQLESTPIAMPADWGEDEIAGMEDFRHFHADMDVPPHTTASEHDAWLKEPPDFSRSAPDAQIDLQLPGPAQ